MLPVEQNPWSDEEIEKLRAMTADGLSAIQIAEVLHRPKSSVAGKRFRLGLASKIKQPEGFRWDVKQAPKTCKVCGKVLEKDQKIYCSHEHAWADKRIDRRKRPNCGECGKPLPRDKVLFCDFACANKARVRDHGNCKTCSKPLRRGQIAFCGMECRVKVWHAETLSLYESGLPSSAIAEKLGINERGLQKRMSALGIKRRHYSPEQIAEFKRLYESGAPDAELIAGVNALPGKRMLGAGAVEGLRSRLKLRRNQTESDRVRKSWATRRKSKPAAEQAPSDPRVGIPLREVYRWGADLGVPLSKRGDVHAVSRAMKRENPEHPGFVLVSARAVQWPPKMSH